MIEAEKTTSSRSARRGKALLADLLEVKKALLADILEVKKALLADLLEMEKKTLLAARWG